MCEITPSSSSHGRASGGGTRRVATRVITIASGKGGVGKTTTVANLGVALGKLGKRVVVIDTDIGLRNLDMMLGLQNRSSMTLSILWRTLSPPAGLDP